MNIKGVTAYPLGDLAPLYDQRLTHDVSLEDLVAVADAITSKYREDGYFLSRAVVPPQTPQSGVGQIIVYEGFISAVEVTGSGAAAVAPGFRGLEGRRPLRLTDLEARMRRARETQGIVVEARLEPDLEDPAAHRLVVEATLDRLEVAGYAENRGPKSLGPWQAGVDVGLNSLIAPGDRLGVSLFGVPDHLQEFRYAELNYARPISERGRLRGYIGVSRARDGADPRSASIGGDSWSTGLSYAHALHRSRDASVSGHLSVDRRRIEQDWDDRGGYRDDLTVARAGLNGHFGSGASATTAWGQVSAGRRASASGRPDITLSRADADRGFWKVNALGTYYRDLGKYAGLFLTGEAQWSPNALLASEEFSLGGTPYGRGYSYGELSGDRAVAASAELRAGWDPSPKAISFLQGYGFLDYGKVWNTGVRDGDAALASAGLGLRLRLGPQASIGLEAARPLTRRPSDERKKSWRSILSISLRY